MLLYHLLALVITPLFAGPMNISKMIMVSQLCLHAQFGSRHSGTSHIIGHHCISHGPLSYDQSYLSPLMTVTLWNPVSPQVNAEIGAVTT